MFARLFGSFLAVLVTALAVFGVAAARTTRASVLGEIELRLVSDASLLRTQVRSAPSPAELQAALREVGGALETRLTVIDADGSVRADSHADPRTMDNHNARPEVAEARSGRVGRNVRHSDTVGYDMMYVATAVDPDRPAGTVVRAALSLARVDHAVHAVYEGLAAAFLAVAAFGAVVTGLLARWIARPLREVREVAEAIAAGDLGRRAPLSRSDEIGSVSAAINRMSAELGRRMASLRAESSKLEAVISSMQEGVIACDADGRVQRCNDAARSLLDLRGDPTGLRVWEAVRLEHLDEEVKGVLRSGNTSRSVREAGTRVVGLCVSPVQGQGVVLVAHDLTEERRYDALRREFVANVSHELRTPLSLALGYVETLRDGAVRDEARAPEFLEVVDRNLRRLSAIVEDLLQLSRLESPATRVRPAPIDAEEFLAKLRDQFTPLAGRKRQALEIEVAQAGIAFSADPDLLERAVGNLVDNAIKYTQDGGRIVVRAARDGGEVVFEVADDGPGIPEPDLARVFERFYRVDKSRSRELGGTGLGLAIVKHVAQLHGGSASVESRAGLGSRFVLRLPARTSGGESVRAPLSRPA